MLDSVILVAGKGTRLGALTHNVPKCLVEVSPGTSILELQLRSIIRESAIRTIVLAVGHMQDHVRNWVVEKFPQEDRIRFVAVNDFETHNTAHSLLAAIRALKGDVPVLQLNGDVVFDVRILRALLSSSSGQSLMCVLKRECGEEEIKVKVEAGGKILQLGKRLAPPEAFGEAFGINLFNTDFVKKLQQLLSDATERNRNAYFEDGIDNALPGEPIYAFDVGKYEAIEIDFPNDLERARHMLQRESVLLPTP